MRSGARFLQGLLLERRKSVICLFFVFALLLCAHAQSVRLDRKCHVPRKHARNSHGHISGIVHSFPFLSFNSIIYPEVC